MKRSNFAMAVAFSVFTIALVSITVARPKLLAPLGGLLSPSGWRVAEAVALLVLSGCFVAGVIQQTAAKRSRRF